jgi:hypothetical protein
MKFPLLRSISYKVPMLMHSLLPKSLHSQLHKQTLILQITTPMNLNPLMILLIMVTLAQIMVILIPTHPLILI